MGYEEGIVVELAMRGKDVHRRKYVAEKMMLEFKARAQSDGRGRACSG